MQYLDSTSNEGMFEDPYIQTSSWPNLSDSVEPQDQLFMQLLQLNPIDVDESQLSEPHKQEFASFIIVPPKNQQNEPNSTTANMTEDEDSMSTRSNESSEQSQSGKKKAKKTAKKREDGNNNIHKKFITVQNEVLKDLKMLKKIKKDLKDSELTFDKGSRHSFVTRLIDTQELFGLSKFNNFLKKYRVEVARQFKLHANPTKADMLLHLLISHYTHSCELFAEGKLEESVKILYDIPGAKEEKYKKQGIKKVKEYKKIRFP